MPARSTALLTRATRFVLILLLAGATCASCYSRTGPPAGGNSSLAPLAAYAGEPAGSSLPMLPALPRCISALPQDLYRPGAAYIQDFPHQLVTRNGQQAKLAPTWPGNRLPAYAMYVMSLQGYSGEASLHLAWAVPPAAGDLYVGFAHWARQTWEWHRADDPALLALSDAAPYIRGDGAVLIALVQLGAQTTNLDALYFGTLPAENSITLDQDTQYQVMRGWEATTYSFQDSPAFDTFKDELFDRAINELGINRLRVEVRSGAENNMDYWTEYQNGTIDYDTWRAHRYATVNDNSDPNTINPLGFHFSELDWNVEHIVQPLMALAQANGEHLWINVNYVAFTSQIGGGLQYDHDNVQEYAEFVLATCQHLRDTYGIVPDSWEVILEPDNVSQWHSGAQIGNAIVASAARLYADGFTPRFVAPSTTNMGSAASYFDQIDAVSGALPYVLELSYHRYSGVSDANLGAIALRSLQHAIGAAMLEHIGSGYEDLYADLTLGWNTSWSQYTIGGGGSDDGGKYYLIDDSDPLSPVVSMGSRTKYLRQYFRYVRNGAQRIGATANTAVFEPLGFVNLSGGYVVVIKAAAPGGAFRLYGLPPGDYGAYYTTGSESNVELAQQAIATGMPLAASIPAQGVITVYAK